MDQRNIYIKEHLDDLFKVWFRRVLLVYLGIFILSFLSDYAMTGGDIARFAMQRAIIAAFLVGVYFLARRLDGSAVETHRLIAYACVAMLMVSLDMRIMATGGHASQYSVGALLLVVLFVGFIPANRRYYATCSLIIYGFYIAPILFFDTVTDHDGFMMKNIALMILIITMVTLRIIYSRRLNTELEMRFELEMYRDNLEDLVEERTAKLTSALSDKDALLSEVHHRVKNNMQVISSLASLQAKMVEGVEVKALFKKNSDRIRSMALVHEMVYRNNEFTGLAVDEYLEALLSEMFKPYKLMGKDVSYDVLAGGVRLDTDRLVPCGLIVNELVSNAFSHAFGPDSKGGLVEVGMESVGHGGYRLFVHDNGQGIPGDVDTSSDAGTLGFMLVHSLVGQLEGEVTINSAESEKGAEVVVVFGSQAEKNLPGHEHHPDFSTRI